MAKGTTWTYKGTVRWTHDNSSVISTAQITWRTEIVRFVERGTVRAALFRGWPSDLDWSNGDLQPAESLLIESGGSFYLIGQENLEDALSRIERPENDLKGIFRDSDIFLKWPLKAGDKFCDSEGMARPDFMYCWFVASVSPTRKMTVFGAPHGQHTAYELIYRTNPDHNQITFVPGIGLSAYEYHHHGTVADTELKLIEFHTPFPAQ